MGYYSRGAGRPVRKVIVSGADEVRAMDRLTANDALQSSNTKYFGVALLTPSNGIRTFGTDSFERISEWYALQTDDPIAEYVATYDDKVKTEEYRKPVDAGEIVLTQTRPKKSGSGVAVGLAMGVGAVILGMLAVSKGKSSS